jgi:opacity protein-like surface antigen
MMILIILPFDAALFIWKENTMHYTKLLGALILICMLNSVAAQTETAAVETDSAVEAEIDTADIETDPAYAENWYGFYAGAYQVKRTVEAFWTTTHARDPDGLEIPFILSDIDDSFRGSETGNGPIVGYNWTWGSWLAGVEVSGGSTDHVYTINRIPGLFDNELPTDERSHVEINMGSSSTNLRLRGGYLANPDLLLFVGAGQEKLDVRATTICPGDINVCAPNLKLSYPTSHSFSDNALGFGLEYAINSILLRLEYREVDFGYFNFTALPVLDQDSFGADAKLELKSEVTQFSVSYEFF